MSIADKLERAKQDLDNVYAKGKKAEYDAFWDIYQNGGKRINYYYAFAGHGWTDKTFRPKYDITMSGSSINVFTYCEVTDLVETLKACGVTMDTSQATSLQAIFGYAKTKSLPVINAAKSSNLNSAFESCKNLEHIEKLITRKNVAYNSAFKNCTALKDIVIEGEIGKNIDFQHSPLSKASIESIVTHLSDTESGQTLTLSKTAVNNAFGSGAEAENVLLGSFGNKAEDGITFTDNNDGSFSVNGTSENTVFFEFAKIPVVANATYQTSLSSNGGMYSGAFSVIAQDSDGIGYDGFTIPMNSDIEYVPVCDGYFVLVYETTPSMEYNNMIVTPSVRKSFTWDALVATKPNWTISLV